MTTQPWFLQVIQAQVRVADPAAPDVAVADNLNRILSFVEFFCLHTTRPPKLIVLPRLALQGERAGWTPPDRMAIAMAPHDPRLAPLATAAQRFGVHIALSAVHRRPDGTTAAVHGLVTPQAVHWSAAEDPPLAVDTALGRVAVVAAIALANSQTVPWLRSNAVDIVASPAHEGYTPDQPARDRRRATIAAEAGVWLGHANQGLAIVSGADGQPRRRFDSRGKSTIHDPTGRLVAATDGPGEAVIAALVQLRARAGAA